MLSKSPVRATAAAAVLLTLASCHTVARTGAPTELNLSFTLENNLIRLSSVTIDGHPGYYVLATASPNVVVDDAFPAVGRSSAVQLGERSTLHVPVGRQDLHGVADAIIGASGWRRGVLSIDYHAGLVTLHQGYVDRGQMTQFRYPDEPAIGIVVDGRRIDAVVDTANPDTLVLPGPPRRGTVRLTVSGIDFGAVDVRYGPVHRARVGNRILSRFLVVIDYGNRLIGLWRDPRVSGSSGLIPGLP
jgi:hypothetical protein